MFRVAALFADSGDATNRAADGGMTKYPNITILRYELPINRRFTGMGKESIIRLQYRNGGVEGGKEHNDNRDPGTHTVFFPVLCIPDSAVE